MPEEAFCGLGQHDPGFRDLVGYDGLIACTASMFGNMQCSTHLVSLSCFPHQDDGICVGKHITTLDGAGDQVVQHDLVARVEQKASELTVVVRVGTDFRLVFTKTHAKQVPRDPVVFFVEYLVVNVLEKFQLD